MTGAASAWETNSTQSISLRGRAARKVRPEAAEASRLDSARTKAVVVAAAADMIQLSDWDKREG